MPKKKPKTTAKRKRKDWNTHTEKLLKPLELGQQVLIPVGERFVRRPFGKYPLEVEITENGLLIKRVKR